MPPINIALTLNISYVKSLRGTTSWAWVVVKPKKTSWTCFRFHGSVILRIDLIPCPHQGIALKLP